MNKHSAAFANFSIAALGDTLGFKMLPSNSNFAQWVLVVCELHYVILVCLRNVLHVVFSSKIVPVQMFRLFWLVNVIVNLIQQKCIGANIDNLVGDLITQETIKCRIGVIMREEEATLITH
jgi:hypothetical protein